MNGLPSSLMLLGVGGAGARMIRSILREYGPGIRSLILDTDAQSGSNGDLPFTLLGGNRLAGRGTGGQPASARAAFQDDPALLDPRLEGIRTVVVVTGLGGGTGGGATCELLKHLHTLGIATLLFATTPFAFEGQDRLRTARTAIGPIEQHADVSVFLPLDELVATSASDNMKEALTLGIENLAYGVTLLWRLLEKPGYIHFDAERLRQILTGCGRAHFATATASGPDRANTILAAFAETPLLKRNESVSRVRTLLIGVLAGDDLRLSEISALTGGLSAAFGSGATLEIGTVNDEENFSGRITVVVLVFDESATSANKPASIAPQAQIGEHIALAGNQRFRHTEQTLWNNENLDIPTYLRRQLTLDR